MITAVGSTQKPSEGYGPFVFGQQPVTTKGLELLSDEGVRKTYTYSKDSLAFGLVPVQDAQYTFRAGAFTMVSFKTEGFGNGNKLQGCLEQLYGPLAKVSTTTYQGQRGKAEVLFSRGYDGSASAFILDKAHASE
ncbi:MAG: hypothetical protein ACRYG7_07695 [Janthinobacterium lividum]